jgi:hypothetical protein
MMEINKIGRSSFEHVLGYFLHMANRLGNQPQGTKMETPAVSREQPYHQQLHIIDASAQMHFPPTQLHFLTQFPQPPLVDHM